MQCPNCDHSNPDGAKFCNECGAHLKPAPLADQHWFGIFQEGGYGDGYYTSFGLETTVEEIMSWQNGAASMSLNRPEAAHFLAEVTQADLLPTDSASTISERFTVHKWWQLVWNGETWVVGEELSQHPASLGLSPLE